MGYAQADEVPVADPLLAPLAVERHGKGTLELDADVVVVGSGAGGGVVAARLAVAGLRVLVVEAGHYVPETSLPRGEGAAFRDLYLGRGTTSTSDLGVFRESAHSRKSRTCARCESTLPAPRRGSPAIR